MLSYCLSVCEHKTINETNVSICIFMHHKLTQCGYTTRKWTALKWNPTKLHPIRIFKNQTNQQKLFLNMQNENNVNSLCQFMKICCVNSLRHFNINFILTNISGIFKTFQFLSENRLENEGTFHIFSWPKCFRFMKIHSELIALQKSKFIHVH